MHTPDGAGNGAGHVPRFSPGFVQVSGSVPGSVLAGVCYTPVERSASQGRSGRAQRTADGVLCQRQHPAGTAQRRQLNVNGIANPGLDLRDAPLQYLAQSHSYPGKTTDANSRHRQSPRPYRKHKDNLDAGKPGRPFTARSSHARRSAYPRAALSLPISQFFFTEGAVYVSFCEVGEDVVGQRG